MASWHPDNERDERRELAELERDEADLRREQEFAQSYWLAYWRWDSTLDSAVYE